MIRKFLFGDYLRSSFVNLFLFSRWASFCLLFLLICDFCQEIYNEIIRKVSCKPIFLPPNGSFQSFESLLFPLFETRFCWKIICKLRISLNLLSFCISNLFCDAAYEVKKSNVAQCFVECFPMLSRTLTEAFLMLRAFENIFQSFFEK